MRFATDENLDRRILDGPRQRLPELDIVCVQDITMLSADDPDLLGYLAEEGRILITHDVNTMPGFVFDRVRSGQPTPGVIIVRKSTPIGLAIDDLEIMVEVGVATDFVDQVRYVPIN